MKKIAMDGKTRRSEGTAAAAVFALILSLLAVASPLHQEAAVGADGRLFDPGYIISDEAFFNSAAMTADQIQSFMSTKVPNCAAANGQPCLKNYRQNTTSRAQSADCSAYTGRVNESAAEIIYNVGVACGISPQVLLVTLQKERGLVLKSSPTTGDYQVSMGYGCPDTAACDTQYYGFYNQVYNAARQFKIYTRTSTQWNYQPGRSNTILYNPNAGCGSSSVFIKNQATANLYIYTPYQPNTAALANLYGTGDGCSSYGNRNFWSYFTDWFGNPSNWLQAPSFENGSFSGWGRSNGFLNQALYNDPAIAHDGSWYAAANAPVAGRALTQDVGRTTNIDEQVTASIWLRSSSSAPFTVTVALWGLAGSVNEMASQKATVTDDWQQVSVELPIRRSSHGLIRLDIYLETTDGTLLLDDANLQFGRAIPLHNVLTDPSFEGSYGYWAPGNGFVNRQIYNDPAASQDGDWFAASNTQVAGRSLAQEVVIRPSVDRRYNFSIWLRSSDAGTPFTGILALWGLGGTTAVVSSAPFSVDSEWTQVSVSVDTASTLSSVLKAEIYMNTTTATLWLDNAALNENLLGAGSFEGGSFASWMRSSDDVNVAVYRGTAASPAQHRDYFAATNAQKPDNSVFQDVNTRPTVGDTYTAELWVRSSNSFSGTLALWALGGDATEATSVPFTAQPEWSKIRISLKINVKNHTTFRFQIYQTSLGVTLHFDSAQIY